MENKPIKTDLFHFVTVRNPQLLTQNERKKDLSIFLPSW